MKTKKKKIYRVTGEAPPPVGCLGSSCFVFLFLLQQGPAAVLLLLISHSMCMSQKYIKKQRKENMFSLENHLPAFVHTGYKSPQSFEWGEKPQRIQLKATLFFCVQIWFPKITVNPKKNSQSNDTDSLRPVYCMSRPFLWTNHLLAN